MTELETIAHAKSYLEKMANGINPLTGEAVPETDLINQVRISRCLFFVSDILRKVIEQGGVRPPVKIQNCAHSGRRNRSADSFPFRLPHSGRLLSLLPGSQPEILNPCE